MINKLCRGQLVVDRAAEQLRGVELRVAGADDGRGAPERAGGDGLVKVPVVVARSSDVDHIAGAFAVAGDRAAQGNDAAFADLIAAIVLREGQELIRPLPLRPALDVGERYGRIRDGAPPHERIDRHVLDKGIVIDRRVVGVSVSRCAVFQSLFISLRQITKMVEPDLNPGTGA